MSDTKETEGYTTVELTLDNDEVIECAILTVYEAAGKEYIALLPLDENLEPNEAGDVYLYQYNETEDGEPDLGNIEDDEEYEIAADAFDEWMDSILLWCHTPWSSARFLRALQKDLPKKSFCMLHIPSGTHHIPCVSVYIEWLHTVSCHRSSSCPIPADQFCQPSSLYPGNISGVIHKKHFPSSYSLL